MENRQLLDDMDSYKTALDKGRTLKSNNIICLNGVQQVKVRRVSGSNYELSSISHFDCLA